MWTVVWFELRAQDVVERIVDGLVHEMRSHGMRESVPPFYGELGGLG